VSVDLESYVRDAVREEASSSSVLHWNLGDYLNHWSPSSLTQFRRCPYQWQQVKIKGRKERPAEAPVTGTSVHVALSRNFEQKIESHEDMPMVELLEWFDDVGWPTTVQVEQAKTGQEIKWKLGPEASHRRGRAMLASYHEQVSPRIEPLATESRFETTEFGLSVPVIGYFDISQADVTVDVKTGRRKYTKAREDWRMQGGIYNFVEEKPVEFHSVSITDGGKVEVVTPLESEELIVSLSVLERQQISQRVRAISAEACLYMELYGPEIDWPMHGVDHSWACSYCGFRPTCPAWSSR